MTNSGSVRGEAGSVRGEPGSVRGEPGITFDVRHHTSVDSTNRVALDLARRGAREGVVVVADHQSAGRGRLGRSWESAPGTALLVSVVLRPAVSAEELGIVGMAVGVALAEAVEEVAGFVPALKWPNDLVVGDRKLAGILCESEAGAGVVVGVGCNLTRGGLPEELAALATSCEEHAGQAVARDALLSAFLARLGARYADLGAVPAAYRERLATTGREVRVELPDGVVEGTAVAVDENGRLHVRTDAGADVLVTAGDVVHLRTVGGA